MNNAILITGGTKGIGFAAAQELASDGYNLILTYHSDADVAEDAKNTILKTSHVEIELFQLDISDLTYIDKLNNYIIENSIQLSGIIFNAGLTYRSTFEKMKIDEWMKIFNSNIHFPVFFIQNILPNLQKGACIIFTGSLMGIYPHAMSLAYGVTKSGIHSLVENLVKFLEPYEIRVNAVAPGFVDTEWQKNKPADIRKNIENKLSMHRFCSAKEVGEVYKFIFHNKYFNGEIVTLSGGYCYK